MTMHSNPLSERHRVWQVQFRGYTTQRIQYHVSFMRQMRGPHYNLHTNTNANANAADADADAAALDRHRFLIMTLSMFSNSGEMSSMRSMRSMSCASRPLCCRLPSSHIFGDVIALFRYKQYISFDVDCQFMFLISHIDANGCHVQQQQKQKKQKRTCSGETCEMTLRGSLVWFGLFRDRGRPILWSKSTGRDDDSDTLPNGVRWQLIRWLAHDIDDISFWISEHRRCIDLRSRTRENSDRLVAMMAVDCGSKRNIRFNVWGGRSTKWTNALRGDEQTYTTISTSYMKM